MVYVDPKNLGYQPYWRKWLRQRHPDEVETLEQLFGQFFPATIDYVLEGVDGSNQEDPLTMVVGQTNLNMITQLCQMFDAMLPLQLASVEEGDGDEEKAEVKINTDVVSAIFMQVSHNKVWGTISVFGAYPLISLVSWMKCALFVAFLIVKFCMAIR